MQLTDEGYIKYNIQWKKNNLLPNPTLLQLISYRDKLKQKKMIGIYPDGIGFGNISHRIENSTEFYISGTRTGAIIQSLPQHYAKVTDYSFSANTLHCEGEVQASSEALTHGAFYMFGHKIHAVLHVHHLDLWNALLGIVPTTSHHIAYGTSEMAFEIQRLLSYSELYEKQILVMAGHKEGIFTFGETLEEAYTILIDYYNLFRL